MSTWFSQQNNANKLRQSYLKGFLDISGGGVQVRNDASLNFFQTAESGIAETQPGFAMDASSIYMLEPGSKSVQKSVPASNLWYLDLLDLNLKDNIDALNIFKSANSTGLGDINSKSAAIAADASVGGRLVVGGDATFQANVTIAKNLTVGGNLIVSGSEIINADLFVKGDAHFYSRVWVGKQLYLYGDNADLFVGKNAYVTGDTALSSYLDVSGASTFQNTVEVTGKTTLKNELEVQNDASFNAKMRVESDASFNGSMDIKGTLRVAKLVVGGDDTIDNASVVFNDAMTLTNTLDVVGDASFNKIIAHNDVSLNSTLNVQGDALLKSKLTVKGATDVSGAFHATGATTLESTIRASGAATLLSTLDVTGKITAIAGMDVIGDASFNKIIAHNDVSLNSTLNVEGDALLKSKLTVKGATDVSGAFHATGATTLESTLRASGAATLLSTLNVAAKVTAEADLEVIGRATVDGSFVLLGDASMNSKLAVSSDASFNSNVDVKGHFTAMDVSAGTFKSTTLYINGPDYTGSSHTNCISAAVGSGDINIVPGSAADAVHIIGKLTVDGDVNFNGSFTKTDTIINVTEALDISNNGTTATLRVMQHGSQPIATFSDSDGITMLIDYTGKVGVGNGWHSLSVDGVTNRVPQAVMDISGDLLVADASRFKSDIQVDGNYSSTNGNLTLTNGNLTVGGTSNLTGKLTVSTGDIQITTGRLLMPAQNGSYIDQW